ncbi:MAG: IS21 family transposase [Spirochaetaceae bacterium]
MYQKIQNCKKQKYSKMNAAAETGLDPKTVRKYWNMSEKEYLDYKISLEDKIKVFEPYKDELLAILEVNKGIKNHKVFTSSIFDVLEEIHGVLPGGERTLRNYISYLKQSNDFDLSKGVRLYTPVEDLPFGKQLQLDFGETKIQSGEKAYIFTTVLSASRFKYVSVQDKPFTTVDVIRHLLDCFDCIGGIPKEIAIDQDKVMIVKENYGAVILTKAFSDFKKEQGFSLFVCRKADPETKGKVENLVKYVKTSFFSAREFKSFKDIPSRLESWMDRRANGKISQANGCIPSDLIRMEREELLPLRMSIYRTERVVDTQSRRVSGKSMISVNSCYYSVPKKYLKKNVWIYNTDTKLFIYNGITGDLVAEHSISLTPGATIIDKQHFRSFAESPAALVVKLEKSIDSKLWLEFVQMHYRKYTRYYRDQHPMIMTFLETDPDIGILEEAIEQCFDLDSYSATNLKEAYNYCEGKRKEVIADVIPALLKTVRRTSSPEIQRRNLQYYTSLISIIGGVL